MTEEENIKFKFDVLISHFFKKEDSEMVNQLREMRDKYCNKEVIKTSKMICESAIQLLSEKLKEYPPNLTLIKS